MLKCTWRCMRTCNGWFSCCTGSCSIKQILQNEIITGIILNIWYTSKQIKIKYLLLLHIYLWPFYVFHTVYHQENRRMSQERQYLDLFYTAPSILGKHLHPYSIALEEAYLNIQVLIVFLGEMLIYNRMSYIHKRTSLFTTKTYQLQSLLL